MTEIQIFDLQEDCIKRGLEQDELLAQAAEAVATASYLFF